MQKTLEMESSIQRLLLVSDSPHNNNLILFLRHPMKRVNFTLLARQNLVLTKLSCQKSVKSVVCKHPRKSIFYLITEIRIWELRTKISKQY